MYEHFFADFGPLNLGRVCGRSEPYCGSYVVCGMESERSRVAWLWWQLYRFCERLHRMLQDPANAGKVIHYYSATDPHKRANSAFLVGGFCIVCLGWDASKAFTPFLGTQPLVCPHLARHITMACQHCAGVYPPFIPFRDAAFGLCSYTITLLDCFRALEKVGGVFASVLWRVLVADRKCAQACLHKFFDYASFNIEEYETLENIQNGDLNWLVPASHTLGGRGYATLCIK